MATIGNTNITLAEWSKRRDPSGKIALIIEALEERCPASQDAVYVEGNLPNGHRSTRRTSVPAGTWRNYNEGVGLGKTTTDQVVDVIGMHEMYSECDKALADLGGDTKSFRWSEDVGNLAGMGNEDERVIFKGDSLTNPEEPQGLEVRYNTIGTQVFEPATTTDESDQRSIWLITWGANTFHLFFPKGSNAGLVADDKGQVTITTATAGVASSAQYEGYRTHYQHHFGVCVRDTRSIVRICNVDSSTINAGTDIGFAAAMIRALHLARGAPGKQVFYMAPSVLTAIDVAAQAVANANMALTMKQWGGKEVSHFRGVPLREVDALEADEATLT